MSSASKTLFLPPLPTHRALAYVPRMLWSQPTADVTTYVAETTLPGSNDIGTSQISPERLSHRAALKSCRPITMRPREGEVDYLPAARRRAAQLQATASDQTLDQSDNRLHSRVGASLCHRTDTPAEPLRASDPRHSTPLACNIFEQFGLRRLPTEFGGQDSRTFDEGHHQVRRREHIREPARRSLAIPSTGDG